MDRTLKVFAQTNGLNNSNNINYYAPLLKFPKYTNIDFYRNSRFIIKLVNIGADRIAYGEVYVSTHRGSNSGNPLITAKYMVKPTFDCFIVEESDCYILYVKANATGAQVLAQVLYASNIGFLEAINFENFTIDKSLITNNIVEFTNFNDSKFPNESYFVTSTTEKANMYAKIGKIKVTTTTQGAVIGIQISQRDNANPSLIAGTLYFKVRNQTGTSPTLLMKSAGVTSDFISENLNIIGIILDGSEIELYVEIKTVYTGYIFKPLIWDYTDSGTTVEFYGEEELVSNLPAGTQVQLFT